MQLNLTRLWRSRNFDELVGQDLVVKLIKNSLYRNFFFPVYLLSGTHGCGKTSMGRLFATALNCSELKNFQNNPKVVKLPCLNCYSCNAMQKGEHPDFIEIDAASHTGVDNMRKIIESSAYVPVLGSKKVFLIDEAHMLSKAAFNALLKVLEEPPKAAIFMLATTDPHKILDTVKSRCFQLLFQPVEPSVIAEHLSNICIKENIKFDSEALYQIALSSEGSIRDSINILERLRLANSIITKKLVLETLGFIDENKLLSILSACIVKDTQKLLNLLKQFNIEKFDASLTWKKLVQLLRTLIWTNQNISNYNINYTNQDNLKNIASKVSLESLLNMLEVCYKYEGYLQKSSASSIILESLFLTLALSSSSSLKKNLTDNISSNNFSQDIIKTNDISSIVSNYDCDKYWLEFLKELGKLNDSLVVSIFKQSKYKKFDKDNCLIIIELPSKLEFFEEELNSSKKIWQPILNKCYNKEIKLKVEFNVKESFKSINNLSNKTTDLDNNKKVITKPISYSLKNEKTLDFSIKDKWPKVNLLLKYFPGIITEVKESQ